MEHMKLSDSGISYSITVCEHTPHQHIGNLPKYILLLIWSIYDITGMLQVLLFYTFIVLFERFTFHRQLPRINWIQRHFVNIKIRSICYIGVYRQAKCATGNSIVHYL